MDVTVNDEPDRSRFVAQRDGETLGFADYRRRGTIVAITHTEVQPRFEGQGVGSALIGAALDQLRARGEQVLPFCPFVQTFIARHSEYAPLVPAERRSEFRLPAPGDAGGDEPGS